MSGWASPWAVEQILAEVRWTRELVVWGFGAVCVALNFLFLWMWRRDRRAGEETRTAEGRAYVGLGEEVIDRSDWKPFDRSELAG